MNEKIKSYILCIAMIFAVVTLLGCHSEENENVKIAEKNLTADLESDLQDGYLNYYKILNAESYTVAPEDIDDPDIAMQCKTANTHIIYELRLGNNTGETGLIQMERYSHVEKDENGNITEIPEDTAYFDYDLHEEKVGTYEATIAGLNSVIWSNDYQPCLKKEQVQGKTAQEIAKLLFEDWMNSFHEWRNNSFIITDYRNIKISGMETAEDNPVAGYKKEELTYPDAKRTYVFGAMCDYTFIGKGPQVFSDSMVAGGGKAFGNDGGKVAAAVSFINTTNGFVLTEWEEYYTMDTISNCKKKIAKLNVGVVQ